MSIQVAVFLSFLAGFSVAFLIMSVSISAHWQKKIQKIDQKQKYDLWLSAWKYCIFRCLDEWNEPVENFATNCANETFDEWNKTLK